MGENCFVIKQTEKNIPLDEILVHLPARHLQILKRVSKDWLHLIATDYFVRRHLSKSINRIRVLLTFPYTKDDCCNPNPPTMLDYYENTLLQIPYPPQFCKSSTTIAGSADGLICLHDKTFCKTAVFNPSTGKCFTSQLWTQEYDAVFSWFGKYNINPEAGEYVLVLGRRTWPKTNTLNNMLRCLEFEVYKFGRTYLNRIQSALLPVNVFPVDQRGTLVQGVVYWPVTQVSIVYGPNPFKILAYHIDSNTLSEIPAPVHEREFRLGVGIAVGGGGLFATAFKNKFVFDVWVMKEYSCWTKYANIHIKEGFEVLSPLGFFPNGDMVLDVDKDKLIRYNFNHNEEILLHKYDHSISDAIMCVDSLVSP